MEKLLLHILNSYKQYNEECREKKQGLTFLKAVACGRICTPVGCIFVAGMSCPNVGMVYFGAMFDLNSCFKYFYL